MKGLTESTLDGYFKKTVELLKLLYEELKQEVFSCDYNRQTKALFQSLIGKSIGDPIRNTCR